MRVTDPRSGWDRCFGDCWYLGDPEYEIWIFESTSAGVLTTLRCIGQSNSNYDQNGNFWSGMVEVLSESQWEAVQSSGENGFKMMLWEDDEAMCVLKANTSEVGTALEALYGAGVVIAIIASQPTGLDAGAFLVVPMHLALFFDAIQRLDGADDFIGDLVTVEEGHSYPTGTTHWLKHGSSDSYGRAIFQRRWSTSPTPSSFYVSISGASVVQSGASCHWSTSAVNGSGSYSFEWTRDGEVVSTASDYTGAGGTFYLQVAATDMNSLQTVASDIFYVTTSSSAGPCDQFLRALPPVKQ